MSAFTDSAPVILPNGTFDRTDTQTRQVWVNGILAVDLRRDLLPKITRDDQGRPIRLAPWGTFAAAP